MDEDGEPQKMRDHLSNQPQSLDDVIWTDELENRNARTSESERERRITSDLTHALAKSPDQFFSKLVQAIVELTNGESAGVSILDKSRGIFVWPAVEGGLASYVGSGTPSDFGPCGTVLDRNAPVLFIHPQKHFTYLREIQPSLEEVLLMPFRMDGQPIGTIWAALHQPGSQFDAEDRRLLKNLSDFAAAAYRALVKAGQLEAIISNLPGPYGDRRPSNEDGKWCFGRDSIDR